ncbi:Profilin [Pseudocohnilembus persalinus]|uniref:Profilin n=1 Tax=Pseudocohnilembus persalinus TaxID=266149 RepID=A0A0V0QFS5_PSEPJ|nr:Profilin [Pseudocohnilembus persalinus]|eukprot:KRX01051.1 Profilin [Pseudocohnilembus persalinus]
MAENQLNGQALTEALQKEEEWAKAIIFDEDLNIIAQKNCQASQDELKAYLTAYDSRDSTIGAGFVLLNNHYDVHRFHPPLIYGRRGDADNGEGISLAVGTPTNQTKKVYLIITYELPIVSARAVPQQINFYNTQIGELQKF